MRHLKAILVADIHRFSAMVEAREAETLAALVHLRDTVLEPQVTAHNGECLRRAGDGVLGVFDLAADALAAALAIQDDVAQRALRFSLRIGLHLAEITREEDTIHGHGINLATRIEALAPPGGIAASEGFATACPGAGWLRIGRRRVKNISTPIDIYSLGSAAVRLRRRSLLKQGAVGIAAAFAGGFGGAALFERYGDQVNLTGSSADAPVIRPEGLSYPRIIVRPLKALPRDPGAADLGVAILRSIMGDVERHSPLEIFWGDAGEGPGGLSAGARETLREAGGDLLLDGTIVQIGARLRLELAISDLADRGVVLWSDQIDMSERDVFDQQNEALRRVVPVITALGDARGPLVRAASVGPALAALAEADRALARHDIDAARAALDLAAAIAPAAPKVEARQLLVGLMRDVMDLRRPVTALRAAADRGSIDAPNVAEFHAIAGLLYAMDGQAGRGARFMSAATELSPYSRDIRAMLALTLILDGKERLARRVFADPLYDDAHPARWQNAIQSLASLVGRDASPQTINHLTVETRLELALIIASTAMAGEIVDLLPAQEKYRRTFPGSPGEILNYFPIAGETGRLEAALSAF